MKFTYSVTILAPNDFAAAAFIGSLHESADHWRRMDTPIHIISIDKGDGLAHSYDVGDEKPPIDTIPLF
jgi:hypothetical protein